MKSINIYRFITALTVLSFLYTGSAYPLGLGEISVKGSPDGLLQAEIPLLLGPGESDVKASIASDADYGMMNLHRPDFLDSLTVSIPDRDGGKVRKIVVRSNRPLRIPSFELVIKVTAGGGTIIEKFFLALDFRKTLSLELPEDKAGSKPTEIATVEEPTLPKEEPEKITHTKLPDEPPVIKEKTPPAPKPETVSKPKDKRDRDTKPDELYVTVQSGDTLYRVVYRLRIPKNLRHGAVIALHKKNPESFIRGDINRLKSGKRLYYDNIETLAAKYSGKKIPDRIDKYDLLTKPSSRPGLFSMILPAAELIPTEDITTFTAAWINDWVSNENGKLSENYSTNFVDSNGKGKEEFLKGRIAFNNKNKNRKIDFENLTVLRTGRESTVYFTQWFRSDTYASIGLKKLTIEKTPAGLKILNEEFKSRQSATEFHPWVVYIAYTKDLMKAKEIIASLRSAGYEAFEGRSFLAPTKGYLIFVGRAGRRAQIEKISTNLKEEGKNRAKVLRFPFSLEAGIFAGRAEAESARNRLLEKGFSPYLVESMIDGKIKYGVYIGAYVSKVDAETAIKTINNKEFSLKISKP